MGHRTGKADTASGGTFVRRGENLLRRQVNDEGNPGLGLELGRAPDMRPGKFKGELGPGADVTDTAVAGGVELVTPAGNGGKMRLPGGDRVVGESGFMSVGSVAGTIAAINVTHSHRLKD